MIWPVLQGFLITSVISAFALALTLPWLRKMGVIDIPVGRSLHSRPVVRGAGLALLPAIAVGAVVTGVLLNRHDGITVTFSSALFLTIAIVAVLGFGAIGLSDDFYSHGVLIRLLLQAVLATLVVGSIFLAAGAHAVWALPLSLVLVSGVNITNFMDGANGMLALHGLVTAAWFGTLSLIYGLWGLASLAIALGGALLAFLPVNLKGRAFLGDVGSYALGTAWTVLGICLVIGGVPLEAALAPALVFAIDFAYTLQLRLRAGDRWYQPHKLHIYQRLISAGWPHATSSGLTAALSAACCLLTLPAVLGAGNVLRVVCALLLLVLLAGYVRLPVLINAPLPWHRAHSRDSVGESRRAA